jgi:hypothetical protein
MLPLASFITLLTIKKKLDNIFHNNLIKKVDDPVDIMPFSPFEV